MKHILLSYITTALISTSCGKSAKETTINGQVRTFGTGQVVKHPPLKVLIVEDIRSNTTDAYLHSMSIKKELE